MTKSLFLFAIALVLLLGAGLRSQAYVLEGQQWANGNIVMNLELNTAAKPFALPAAGLQDGSATWNAVAQAALNEWNQYLLNVQFTSNTTIRTMSSGDNVNSVLFDSTFFGQSFGSGTLGITLRRFNGTTNLTAESDTIINTAFQWDSYRGNLQPNAQDTAYIFDVRRVLDHELGHNLGLNHPDLATPAQTVTAIMNSVTSDLDHIELDDISGVWSMYGQKSPSVPVTVVANPSAGGTVTGGGSLAVNTTHTVTATAAEGYTFKNWEDGSTNPTRTITVPVGGGTYTANFTSALDQWALSTSANSGPVTNILSILYGDGLFRAFGSNGMTTSPDGVTWTGHVAATTQNYSDTVVAYHGGTYVSVGSSGNNTVLCSSSDGFNWTTRTAGFTGFLQAITWGNGLFVAVGSSNSGSAPALIFTSPDGIQWTQRTQGVGSTNLVTVTYGNGMFLALGTVSPQISYVLTSPDGINWTTTTPVTGITSVSSVVYGSGLFFAGVNQGSIAYSPDGLNWSVSGPFYFSTIFVGYGNGLDFLFASNFLETAPSGGGFQNRTLVDNSVNYGFAYGAGRFVGIGAHGVLYSGLVPALQPVLPVIGSATTRSATLNSPLNYQITASNTPLAFNATGLPAGLSVNVQTGAITGSPTVSGTFPVTLFATNDAGSGTATLSLTVSAGATPQSFSDWATANNVTGSMSDTPRGDGVPNLLKYLYDIDPSAPISASARASLPVLGTASSGTQLTLTFPENKILEGVGVTVQTSTDMLSWSTPPQASITPTGNTNASGDLIMVAQVPLTANTQFIRLVVTPQ